MLHYLQIQAYPLMWDYSRRMLLAGDYNLIPNHLIPQKMMSPSSQPFLDGPSLIVTLPSRGTKVELLLVKSLISAKQSILAPKPRGKEPSNGQLKGDYESSIPSRS